MKKVTDLAGKEKDEIRDRIATEVHLFVLNFRILSHRFGVDPSSVLLLAAATPAKIVETEAEK